MAKGQNWQQSILEAAAEPNPAKSIDQKPVKLCSKKAAYRVKSLNHGHCAYEISHILEIELFP
jgi:hypothetical protein